MSSEYLASELAKFDEQTPLEESLTPPASWYVDDQIFDLERTAVFTNNWLPAVRLDQVARPGDFATASLGAQSILVVRGEDGELRAFHNVCRHRAAAVACGQGWADQFVCPYHGWTYGLGGQLLRAPELGGVKNFSREHYSLAPVAVAAWGPFAFVNLRAGQPRELERDLAALRTRLAENFPDGPLRFVARKVYSLACNWKVFVDNYLDGGYHVAHLHKGLAGQLDLRDYRTEIFERFSVQSCSGAGASPAAATSGVDFAERIGAGAWYAWVYPNLMINRYGDILDTNIVVPLSADRCEVIYDWWFMETEGDAARAFIEKSLAASDAVQQEDSGICESVQRGLSSGAFDRGPYSALREKGQHHFHRLLANDLQGAFSHLVTRPG
jgi:choline monooxygenase